MAKMTEAEIQQKLSDGWWWGREVSCLNADCLYFGSKALDGMVDCLDPNYDREQELADEKARLDAIRALPTPQEAEELGRALYAAVTTADKNFVLATWYDHRRRLAIKDLHGEEIAAVKFRKTIGFLPSEADQSK